MKLEFTTEINGKPTLVIDKIWQAIFFLKDVSLNDYYHYRRLYSNFFGRNWDMKSPLTPKRHTIREDKRNRWRAGMTIDFYINVRAKNMLCFAPKVEVKSTQNIEISYCFPIYAVFIDGRMLTDTEVDILVKNDGFDSTDDFFAYFDKDFTGKIIHWTGLKY